MAPHAHHADQCALPGGVVEEGASVYRAQVEQDGLRNTYIFFYLSLFYFSVLSFFFFLLIFEEFFLVEDIDNKKVA